MAAPVDTNDCPSPPLKAVKDRGALRTPREAKKDRNPWQFSLRGLMLFAVSVILGLSFWKTENIVLVRTPIDPYTASRTPSWLVQLDCRDCFVGLSAAISFWIVLGLLGETRALWRTYRQSANLPREERWGWRMAIASRLVICGLIVEYFLSQVLIATGVVALGKTGSPYLSPWDVCDAVLLTALIAAVFRPRRATPQRGVLTRAIELLWGIAGVTLFLFLLFDSLLIQVLIHLTVYGIEMAQPLKYSMEYVNCGNPAHISRCCRVAAVGVVALVAACVSLRLLALRWRGGRWQRVCLGVPLAATLAVIVIVSRYVFIEVPKLAPIMTANIPSPSPPLLAAAVVLTLFLAGAIAKRWCGSSPVEANLRPSASFGHPCRAAFLVLLIGLAAMMETVIGILKYYVGFTMGSPRLLETMGQFVENPAGCLSLALTLLAVQVLYVNWRRPNDAFPTEKPQLMPGLFLLTWSSLTMIILCSAPILASWAFLVMLLPPAKN
ncbi:MAG: hypothetical protein ABFC96_05720 [Thermoguttaceae bacterium]